MEVLKKKGVIGQESPNQQAASVWLCSGLLVLGNILVSTGMRAAYYREQHWVAGTKVEILRNDNYLLKWRMLETSAQTSSSRKVMAGCLTVDTDEISYVTECRKKNHSRAILFIPVRQFKRVNDTGNVVNQWNVEMMVWSLIKTVDVHWKLFITEKCWHFWPCKPSSTKLTVSLTKKKYI